MRSWWSDAVASPSARRRTISFGPVRNRPHGRRSLAFIHPADGVVVIGGAVGQVVLQVAILAVTSIVVEFAVLAGYGALASRAARLAETPRVAAWLERAAGVLLIAAGLQMAALRRAE